MAGIKDQEQIDELRKRLYDRAQRPDFTPRHQLTDTPIDVARGWGGVTTSVQRPPVMETPAPIAEPSQEALSPSVFESEAYHDTPGTRKRFSYRLVIVGFSLAVFIIAVGISSVYLFFGANQISGKNISVEITGPAVAGGGDVLPIQIGVNNFNSVPIESATLIITYPGGTKSVEDSPRDLFQERVSLDTLAPGEAKNTPLQIAVFGEENQEKIISATVEYRVAGSNGTFYKEATPFTFKINSSPLVLSVNSIEKVAAGQEIEVKVTLQSNSLTPLQNVLVSAEYPNNFSFVSANPTPEYGQNAWLVDSLAAQDSQTFTIRGVVEGMVSESFQIRFAAGSPRSDNQFIMGSVLAMANTDFSVERPFIQTGISINGDGDGNVVSPVNSLTRVSVNITNTHSEPIYDMSVRVIPKGNVFREDDLSVESGFYNSVDKYIVWEVSGMSDLATVLPGQTRQFTFSINPDADKSTASFELEASVFGRRVSEDRVTEELVGTSKAEVRYSSTITLDRQIAYGTEGFIDRGPIPPEVNKETSYTLTLVANAGVNDITGAVVTASLPQYVRWLNQTSGEGRVEYNPVTSQLRWEIGDIAARSQRELSVQVAIVPSVLQVGTTPVMMSAQDMRATDRFAGVALRATAPPITTELSTEAGFAKDNGKVVSSGGTQDN